MFRVPDNLIPYVDFDESKLIVSKDLPTELEKDVKDLEKSYKAIHKKDDLAEY